MNTRSGPILVCRPQPGADRTATALADQGYQSVIHPLLTIQPSQTPCPVSVHEIDALIFTSANGVTATNLGRWHQKPAYAVGRATAVALQQAGFSKIRHSHGDARHLAEQIPGFLVEDGITVAADTSPHLLWPAARETAFDMSASMAAKGISCHYWHSYDSLPETGMPEALQHRIESGEFGAILLTSPRLAGIFADLVDSITGNTLLLTLSSAISAKLPDKWRGRTFSAAEPNEPSLIRLVKSHISPP